MTRCLAVVAIGVSLLVACDGGAGPARDAGGGGDTAAAEDGATPPADGGGPADDSGGTGGCGDGVAGPGEACDGTDLRGLSCAALQLGGGTLACAPGCGQFDTSGCEHGCQPDCQGRECGPDPVCSTSCGTCTEGTCDADGQCQTTTGPGAPVFLSFGTNVTVMDETRSLVFTALLTDPDGIEDLIGGTLKDASSGASYGAFASSAQEGAYTLTLSWQDLDTVVPIYTPTERRFRAEFFDQDGHDVSEVVTVQLACSQTGHTACAGDCVNLQTDLTHCGSCGHPVPPQGEGDLPLVCRGGVPACSDPDPHYQVCPEGCFDTRYNPDHCNSCGKVCAASEEMPPDCRMEGCIGEYVTTQRTSCRQLCPLRVSGGTCFPTDTPGRAYYGTNSFDDLGCDEVPPARDDFDRTFTELHCWCLF